MQTQARICPICHDDHFDNRICHSKDLISAIKARDAEIAALKAKLEEKSGEIEIWERIAEDALSRAHSQEDYQSIAAKLAEALRKVHHEYAPIEAEQALAAYELLKGEPRE